MTKREIVYDIITILKKGNYTDDNTLSEEYVGYKVDEKRAKEIRDTYKRNMLIDPIWLQDYGIVDVSEVNLADDKDFNNFACPIGKVTLPPVVSIESGLSAQGNLGVHTVRNVNSRGEIFYKPFGRLMEIDSLSDGNVLKKYLYYTKIHNALYFLPYIAKVRPIMILERPLDGYVISTEDVDPSGLVIGDSYTVVKGQIIHNSVAYNKGAVFTAVTTSYTGNGIVEHTNQKRRMTDLDEYPMGATMAEMVIIKILTQEYGIEKKQITDIRNNSQDTLKVLQPEVE